MDPPRCKPGQTEVILLLINAPRLTFDIHFIPCYKDVVHRMILLTNVTVWEVVVL